MSKKSVFIEKNYPTINASALTLLTGVMQFYFKNFHDLIIELANNALTISATLLGFFLTILTLLSSIDTRRMQFVKDSGALPRLQNYLKKAILSNIWLIAASFVIKFIGFENFAWSYILHRNIFDYGYLFVFLYNFFVSYRFTKILINLLGVPEK